MGTVPMISVSRKDCPKSTLPTWRTDFARDFTSPNLSQEGEVPHPQNARRHRHEFGGGLFICFIRDSGDNPSIPGDSFPPALFRDSGDCPHHFGDRPRHLPIISGTGPVILAVFFMSYSFRCRVDTLRGRTPATGYNAPTVAFSE